MSKRLIRIAATVLAIWFAKHCSRYCIRFRKRLEL